MAVKDNAFSLAKRNIDRGIDAEGTKNYASAKMYYEKSVTHLNTILSASKDKDLRQRALKFNTLVKERLSHINSVLRSRTVSQKALLPPRTKSCTTTLEKDICRKMPNLDEEIVRRILHEVYETASSITFDDIVGNDRAKQSLKEAVIYPSLRPDLYTGLRSPVGGILLFGPPGNGKTMLARAVASKYNVTFFNISAASILSKWVGIAEKTVRALFSVARYMKPSIIFLDEVDSLLSARRDDRSNDSSLRVLTQLLMEIDGVSSGEDRPLVLAATNRPFELDEAALRRFPKRIYVRMPDITTRKILLNKLLCKDLNHCLSTSDVHKISQITEGYSSSDLHQLAKEAALEPLRELSESEMQTISTNQLRPISIKDFLKSVRTILPSVDQAKLDLYENWDRQFGGNGAR